MGKLDYGEILDVFLWGMDKLSKPTLRNLLAGYEEFEHRRDIERYLQRLRRQRLVASSGKGDSVRFRITDTGRRYVRRLTPAESWDRSWDGMWRVVSFDVPEVRRKDRVRLWRALRARKIGLLQRSVWVWPHSIEQILQEIIKAEGIPECFCGFEARRLFLCTNAEVVEAAWDFEEIAHRQRAYLRNHAAGLYELGRADCLATVAATARAEHLGYEHAFSVDPLLPRSLWPKSYRGELVQEQHERFRRELSRRAERLAAAAG